MPGDGTDDGYRLRPEVHRVNRALQAVTFQDRRQSLTVDAAFDCHFCGAPAAAVFDRGLVEVRCTGCEYPYFTDIVESTLETFETDADVLSHFSQYAQLKILTYALGICRTCGTAVEPSLGSPDELFLGKRGRRSVSVYLWCGYCGVEADLTRRAGAGTPNSCTDPIRYQFIYLYLTFYYRLE